MIPNRFPGHAGVAVSPGDCTLRATVLESRTVAPPHPPSCFPTRISREALKVHINAWTLLQKDSVIVGKDLGALVFFTVPQVTVMYNHIPIKVGGQQTEVTSWLLLLQI